MSRATVAHPSPGKKATECTVHRPAKDSTFQNCTAEKCLKLDRSLDFRDKADDFSASVLSERLQKKWRRCCGYHFIARLLCMPETTVSANTDSDVNRSDALVNKEM